MNPTASEMWNISSKCVEIYKELSDKDKAKECPELDAVVIENLALHLERLAELWNTVGVTFRGIENTDIDPPSPITPIGGVDFQTKGCLTSVVVWSADILSDIKQGYFSLGRFGIWGKGLEIAIQFGTGVKQGFMTLPLSEEERQRVPLCLEFLETLTNLAACRTEVVDLLEKIDPAILVGDKSYKVFRVGTLLSSPIPLCPHVAGSKFDEID